jgi:hypothetical protein
MGNSSTNLTPWSFQDRFAVLAGLCEVLKASLPAAEFFLKVNTECQKLWTISAKTPFREAVFLKVVKEIAGDEGMAVCRSLLEGIEDDGAGYADLQSRVTEGRCTVCMGSTYEEDCEDGDDIILCDGCNAEAHLKCLNMTAVPNTEWHCILCQDRLVAREARTGQHFGVKNLDGHRDREQEEDLVNKALDRRGEMAQGLGVNYSDDSDDTCAYCSLSESELCSPMVVGQCRREHEAALSLSKPTVADNYYPGRTGTGVKFMIYGELSLPPPPGVPYFPLVESEHGQRLLTQASDDSEERRQSMVVHQICALQMYEARMDRERHAVRRRRTLVAKRALSLAGISCRPLGTDKAGREYWRFPTSDDLFIRGINPVRDMDKEAFNQLLAFDDEDDEEDSDEEDNKGIEETPNPIPNPNPNPNPNPTLTLTEENEIKKNKKPKKHLKSSYYTTWRRVSDPNSIRDIVDLLSGSYG